MITLATCATHTAGSAGHVQANAPSFLLAHIGIRTSRRDVLCRVWRSRKRPRIDNSWYDALGDAWWDADGPVAALHEVNPARLAYFLAVLRPLRRPRQSIRVLDLGCGGGLLALPLAAQGIDVVGVDRSRPSLAAARRRAGQDPSDARPVFAAAVGEALPFPDATFDAICAADVLEHVADLSATLDEAARVLRPGGRLLFDTINRTWLSRLAFIWVAQDLLRFAPAHTHDFHAFLRPSELQQACEERGMRWGAVHGLRFRRHPVAAAWGYLRRRRLGGFELSRDLRLSYIGYAERSADTTGDRRPDEPGMASDHACVLA